MEGRGCDEREVVVKREREVGCDEREVGCDEREVVVMRGRWL